MSLIPYEPPRVRVFQQFEETPSVGPQPLYAFIFGENYHLFRYTDPSEKPMTLIGNYDRVSGVTAVWPNRPAGAVVDRDYTRVFIDNAWLEYFRDYVGSGDTIKAVVGHPNRIRADALVFASFGDDARSVAFGNRDVQVGDGVVIRATACDQDFEIHSRVTRLIHETLPAEIEVPVADEDNAPATSELTDVSVIEGDYGTVNIAADAAGYSGEADGDTVESYFLTVVAGGDFGDAQLSVLSGSGNDNMVDPVIPQAGVPVSIGSRGLVVTFSDAGAPAPFIEGQIFRIDVNQGWVPAELEVDPASTFLGATSGTYIVTVTTGGAFADSPRVLVTSTGTLESSGPYVVTALSQVITLPTGVRLTFTGAGATGLSKNDRYYVDVAPSRPGAIKTLELRNSLPQELYGLCEGVTEPDPVDLDLSLSIVRNIEVPQTGPNMTPYWEMSDTQIAVLPGVVGRDISWQDSLGNLPALPVIGGTVYTHYRALRTDFAEAMNWVTSVGEVPGLLGPVTADNPLALGVSKAVGASRGTPVLFMATKGGSFEAFSEVLESVYDRRGPYGMVPLTYDQQILDAVRAHANEMSAPEKGNWRMVWAGVKVEEITPVLQRDSLGNMLFATILDDPDTSGTQYTRVRCDEAQFVTNGVVPGMIVRGNYYIDPITNQQVYSSWVVDAVLSEEELRLASGPSLAVTVPSRMEVWKNNSNDDIAQQVINRAGAYGDWRVRYVFPDWIGNGGERFDSIYLCAALAGLRSGVPAHQGLTNMEIPGFDDVSRTTDWLGGRLLLQMAAAGVWIVDQDASGMVATRHQLTTDMTDINRREDSLVATFDQLSYRVFDFHVRNRYIGRRNITPQLEVKLYADFGKLVDTIKVESFTEQLGSMIENATILELGRHPTLRDRMYIRVRIEMPAPFNNFDIYLIGTV